MNLFQRTIITTATLVIFGVLIFIFVIHPTISDIKAFNDRIQMERVALENKYTSRRNIKNIVADLKEITTELSPLMDKIIIQKGEEVNFISDLENIAEKNNLVQEIKLTPQEKTKGKAFTQKQNITISLSGNYIDTLKYLNDLEQSKYYIIIYGMNITSAKNASVKAASSGAVRTHLEGYVYFSI